MQRAIEKLDESQCSLNIGHTFNKQIFYFYVLLDLGWNLQAKTSHISKQNWEWF